MMKNKKMLNKDAKKPNFKRTWNRLMKYSKKYISVIVIALITVIVATILQIYAPDIIKEITNEILVLINTQSNDISKVVQIATIIVIMYVVSMFLNIVQSYIMSSVSQKVSNNLRNDISEKINILPLKYFDGSSVGDTISRIVNDVDIVGQTLNQSISSFVGSTVMIIGALIMMFSTNWLLAITSILASLIGFVLIGVIMGKSQKHFIAQQEGLGKLNGYVEEIYTNHNVIQAYNGGKNTSKEFEVINKKLYSSTWKSEFISGFMMPLMSFVGNLGYVAIAVVGAILVSNKSIEFGVISAFLIYVRLFTNALGQVAQATGSLQRTAAAGERVFGFLDEKELENEDSKTLEIENTKGNVEFQNVKFGYNENKTIINDFSAQVKAGQKVAIVGPTGAGKTTIVNLLMRFYEVNSGNILIDGIKTQDVTRENVHEQFCMVLQDTWIFEGTIIENIRYGKESVTDDEVIAACKKLGLHHFIKTLSNGYNTLLTDKASLSEGQKQTITIARAMIKNSPLLILDEATSSVDTRTELIIQKAMDELMKGRTSFVIAHRLSTIKNADLILVMKDGDIIENGNHEELLSNNGFYAELYNSQFQE